MVGTKEQYLERVKGYKPKAFVGGERIKESGRPFFSNT